MDASSEAAEQIVRMTLEGTEVALRITGAGAKNAAAMLLAAALGGFLGAHAGKRLPVPVVRALISTFGFSMTALLFWRAWSHA